MPLQAVGRFTGLGFRWSWTRSELPTPMTRPATRFIPYGNESGRLPGHDFALRLWRRFPTVCPLFCGSFQSRAAAAGRPADGPLPERRRHSTSAEDHGNTKGEGERRIMEKLTIKSPSDVLSFVDQTLSFWPKESLSGNTLMDNSLGTTCGWTATGSTLTFGATFRCH